MCCDAYLSVIHKRNNENCENRIDSVKNDNIVEISFIKLVKIYEAETKWIY